MQPIYFSGIVSDDHDSFAAKRFKVRAGLEAAGFSVSNFDGRDQYSLTSIEQHVIKPSGGFVFMPIPDIAGASQTVKHRLFQELFKAASLSVGIQTRDPNLLLTPENPSVSAHKPVVIINPVDKRFAHQFQCWTPFLDLVQHLHVLGTVKQIPASIFDVVAGPQSAVAAIVTPTLDIVRPSIDRDESITLDDVHAKTTARQKPAKNVCVFCSASTSTPLLLELAEELGIAIAEAGLGLVTGAGHTGMMGKVVDGTAKVIHASSGAKGWTGGSNLLRIFNLEGLPDYMDAIWVTDDIYTRMERMIFESQAFIILPGGMGTVQEFMALLLLKHKELAGAPGHGNLLGNKPIIVLNQPVEVHGADHSTHIVGFWDPLIEIARRYGFASDFTVVSTVDEVMHLLT